MKRMRFIALGTIVVGGLAVVACGNNDDDRTDGGQSLVEVEDIDPGEDCEFGGIVVRSGDDENGDGSLSDDEIVNNVNVCNGSEGAMGASGPRGEDGDPGPAGEMGEPGAPAMSSVASASLSDCPAGGTVISFGVDDNGNEELDADEVQDTVISCNGIEGAQGEDACAPVVRTTMVGPGEECTAGGFLIAYGADAGDTMGAGGAGGAAPMGEACDGILADDEVMGSQYVCHGEKGDTGPSGNTDPMLIKTSFSSTACAGSFGMIVEIGADTSGNGSLESDEVTGSDSICGLTFGYAKARLSSGSKDLVFLYVPEGTSIDSNEEYEEYCNDAGFDMNRNASTGTPYTSAGNSDTTNYYCNSYCCYLGTGNSQSNNLSDFENFGLPVGLPLQVFDRGCGDYGGSYNTGMATVDTLEVTGNTTYTYTKDALGPYDYLSSKVTTFSQEGVIVCQEY